MEWAYFLDIDGTLIELAPSPDEIHVDEQLALLIERLHAWTGGAVALITGRSIADVDRIFPLQGMAIAGQHGVEIRTPDGRLSVHDAPLEGLEAVRTRLAKVTARHPRLLAEFKGVSVALHYRAAPQLAGYAHRLMRRLQSSFLPGYVVQAGKRVVELKPAGKDKGIAISELLQEPPFYGRVPVLLGDDSTDELGFAVVNEIGGHSIKVGRGKSCASWRLEDVAAVRNWLSEAISGSDWFPFAAEGGGR
jgi:trehalose 6-phosphate phosphatase